MTDVSERARDIAHEIVADHYGLRLAQVSNACAEVVIAAKAIDKATRDILAGQSVGDYVMVPRVPTEAMHRAALVPFNNNLAGIRDVWSAMLATAPIAPVADGGQDRKFTFRNGQFVNRVSGEPIPLDEPIIIFRARDRHAEHVLREYLSMATDDHHRQAIRDRMSEFAAYRAAHPERIKEPGITHEITLNSAATPAPDSPAIPECPSCHGLNTSCPDGCGRDPNKGELNGTCLQPTPASHTALTDAIDTLSGIAQPSAGVLSIDQAKALGVLIRHASDSHTAPDALHIVFDGPPGPEAGRFVECETPDGRSVNAGEWHERADGFWELRILATPAPPDRNKVSFIATIKGREGLQIDSVSELLRLINGGARIEKIALNKDTTND